MKTTKPVSFTPGPWIVKGNAFESRISPANGQFRLATLESDNHEADARLVASAPELLEALEQCLTDDAAACFTHQETRPEYMVKRLNTITAIARAAIAKAKATGGQP